MSSNVLVGQRMVRYAAVLANSSQRLGGSLQSRRMARALFMIVKCARSLLPFCADVYGAVVSWVVPHSSSHCFIAAEQSSPRSVRNFPTRTPVSVSRFRCQAHREVKAEALSLRRIDQIYDEKLSTMCIM